jgi:proline dehydrogenase
VQSVDELKAALRKTPEQRPTLLLVSRKAGTSSSPSNLHKVGEGLWISAWSWSLEPTTGKSRAVLGTVRDFRLLVLVSLARARFSRVHQSLASGPPSPRLVRRSVARFMPGERVEDALEAARLQRARGITAILTSLGENLTDPRQADDVTRHYLDVLDRIAASGLDVHISVKPTQLGLDFDEENCFQNLSRLLERALPRQQFIWIDMESSAYVDRTLALFRRAVDRSPLVGVAVQAYLRRTPADLDRLLIFAPAIRLVKGAYLEPVSIALTKKSEIDESYYNLGARLLTAAAKGSPLVHIATHDGRLVNRLDAFAADRQISPARYEYASVRHPAAMQERLSAEGTHARAHRVWRQLVPVVHAPPGRASGQSLVHREELTMTLRICKRCSTSTTGRAIASSWQPRTDCRTIYARHGQQFPVGARHPGPSYSAEWAWCERWHGHSPTAHLPTAQFKDVESIASEWSTLEARIRTFLEGLGEDGVARVFTYRLFSGQEGSSPFWQMLQHVVNHGTYHRGQVTTMLRQLGASPAKSVDLIAFYRERSR